MPRSTRLAKNNEFQRVRQYGKSWAHPVLVLRALPNKLAFTRFGFSVSKQVGNAVMRNRVKRLLREAVRLRAGKIKTGYDIIFVARQAIAGKDYELVAATVEELLQRSRLLEATKPAEPRSAMTGIQSGEQ